MGKRVVAGPVNGKIADQGDSPAIQGDKCGNLTAQSPPSQSGPDRAHDPSAKAEEG